MSTSAAVREFPLVTETIRNYSEVTITIGAPITRVRPQSDPTITQMMRLMEISGSYDFWNRPEEDIYTREDGMPL